MALRIVAVNGAPTSGKTTFEYMVYDIRNKEANTETRIWSVIIPIKDFAYNTLGVGAYDDWGEFPEKTPRVRRLYSDLKDTLDRYCNYTYTNCYTKVTGLMSSAESGIDVLLFIDAREPKDLQMLKDKFNATTMCMRRASAENLETSNHADAEVLNFKYDIEIMNNGTKEDLKDVAHEFCRCVKELKTYDFD